MARSAGLPRVSAVQREARLAGVIEASLAPIPLIMTFLTGKTVAALVRPRIFIAVA